jgi:hypothetical protein
MGFLARAFLLFSLVVFAGAPALKAAEPPTKLRTLIVPAAQIVDVGKLDSHGTADLFRKLQALPKGTFVRFGGQVGPVDKLLETLEKNPAFARDLSPPRIVQGPVHSVSLLNLNVHLPDVGFGKSTSTPQPNTKLRVIRGGLSAAPSPTPVPSPTPLPPGVVQLPGTQSGMPGPKYLCPKEKTLCAIYWPTYQAVVKPEGGCGWFGCTYYCVDKGGAVVATASSILGCPPGTSATTTPGPQTEILGGCTYYDGSKPVDVCAWNPDQTAEYTVRDTFMLDHYDANADCAAGSFAVEVKVGSDDGVARHVYVYIGMPSAPAQPLAHVPPNPKLDCQIAVYVKGPPKSDWRI